MAKKILVSIIGGHKCSDETYSSAKRVGEIAAEEGAAVVSGGLGGVMKAASEGAKEKNGVTIGILPGENKLDANEFIDIAITTGMGYSRNTLVAGTADIVVAFEGEYGTLSEIALSLNAGKEVYGFGTWGIKGVKKLDDPESFREVLKKG